MRSQMFFIRVFLLFVVLCTTPHCWAKNLHLVYIDHEETTPYEQIKDKLETLRVNNTTTGDALIVYLSNEESPMIYCQNLDGFSSDIVDDEAYDRIITDLSESISSSVNVTVDVNTILDILSHCQFAVTRSEIGFDNVIMDFYVGPDLWQLGYNNSFIARLYFALEIAHLDQKVVKFNIFKPKGMKKVYEDNLAFGLMNVENLNSKIFRQYE